MLAFQGWRLFTVRGIRYCVIHFWGQISVSRNESLIVRVSWIRHITTFLSSFLIRIYPTHNAVITCLIFISMTVLIPSKHGSQPDNVWYCKRSSCLHLGDLRFYFAADRGADSIRVYRECNLLLHYGPWSIRNTKMLLDFLLARWKSCFKTMREFVFSCVGFRVGLSLCTGFR